MRPERRQAPKLRLPHSSAWLCDLALKGNVVVFVIATPILLIHGEADNTGNVPHPERVVLLGSQGSRSHGTAGVPSPRSARLCGPRKFRTHVVGDDPLAGHLCAATFACSAGCRCQRPVDTSARRGCCVSRSPNPEICPGSERSAPARRCSQEPSGEGRDRCWVARATVGQPFRPWRWSDRQERN